MKESSPSRLKKTVKKNLSFKKEITPEYVPEIPESGGMLDPYTGKFMDSKQVDKRMNEMRFYLNKLKDSMDALITDNS